MLGWTRKLLNNWIARVFFGLLVVVFVFWGISNVVTLIGADTAVATVGGTKIDIATVQASFQRQVADFAAQNGGQAPSADQRRQIAEGTLSQAIRDALLAQEEKRLGIAVPKDDLRHAITAIPQFQDGNGQFSQAVFTQVLQQNGISPDQFVADIRRQEAGRQLIDAIAAGAIAPAPLFDRLYAYAKQQRVADTVSVTLPASAPALPAKPVLERYWKNHPADFTAPEYRTAQVVILSPELLAAHEQVPEADIAALYAQEKSQFVRTATRSVRVITAPDQATAETLAKQWNGGADWTAMQTNATAAGATAIEMDGATQPQLPSPQLGDAVFAAVPGSVTGPVKGDFGYYVFKVTTAVAGGDAPLAAVHDKLREQLALQQARAQINQDIDKLQDALAGQTPLDKLPGDLGLVAVEGTLDASGNTPDGQQAPIPGGDDVKSAIVKAIFAAHPGDQVQLQTGPDDTYFAVSLENVTPPALEPFDRVAGQVAAAWQMAARTRVAEMEAAQLLVAVKSGQTLAAAAKAAGLADSVTPPLDRPGPDGASGSGLPAGLLRVLFSLDRGQGTMVQTDNGFIVAQLDQIITPRPEADPIGSAKIVAALNQSYRQDVTESLIGAIHDRVGYTVNQKLFASLTE